MKHSKLLMLSQYQNFTQIKRIHIWTKLRAHSRCMHRAQISQVTQIRPNTVQTYASLSSYPLSILIENPQTIKHLTHNSAVLGLHGQTLQNSTVHAQSTNILGHTNSVGCRPTPPFLHIPLSIHFENPSHSSTASGLGRSPHSQAQQCSAVHSCTEHKYPRSYKSVPVRYRPTPPFLHTVNLDRKLQPLKHCLWTQVTQIWPSKVQTYILFSTLIVNLDRKPQPLKQSLDLGHTNLTH